MLSQLSFQIIKQLNLTSMKRWNVPWSWQIVYVIFFLCEICYLLPHLMPKKMWSYFGLQLEDLINRRGKKGAKVCLISFIITTAGVLGVLFALTKFYQPLPEDIFHWDNGQNGLLFWVGLGFVSPFLAAGLTGLSISIYNYFTCSSPPKNDRDLLKNSASKVLSDFGISSVSMICYLVVSGVLAPLSEEFVFRGFLMSSMTRWVPTPVAVGISAAIFAFFHFPHPARFLYHFTGGIVMGLSYAQTRNLLTPFIVHSVGNIFTTILAFIELRYYATKQQTESS